ncbi:hypothetical protein AB1484_35130 [Parafrankia sp. FMc6]|uniref:dCTP deaminase domain-containing protein n=1 Tax=Parafrankia soli TaxID=2599596 RepID=UPI0034D662B8
MTIEPGSEHPIDLAFSVPPKPARILTDFQIREAVDRLGLIGGEYDPSSAKYASYELHASRFVEWLFPVNGVAGFYDCEPDGNDIVIESHATVRVYSAESINLPPYMSATATALGQLFAVGLCAGNTYVDPGSTGPIYLAITNLLDRAVRMPVGCALSRVQFFVLGDVVSTAHGGPETRRPILFRVDEPTIPAGGPRELDEVIREIDDIRRRVQSYETREQRLLDRITIIARRRAKAIKNGLTFVAALVLVLGVLSLTPISAQGPTWLRIALIVGAGFTASFAVAQSFIGGTVREWILALERNIEKRYLRRMGFEPTPDPEDLR